MLLFSASVTCSDGWGGWAGGVNVFIPKHLISTLCKLINNLCLLSFFQFPRRREANISLLHEVGFLSLHWQNWVRVCCFGQGVWSSGCVLPQCIIIVKQWNHQLEGKQGSVHMQQVCSPLCGLLWRRKPHHVFQTQQRGEDAVSEWCHSKGHWTVQNYIWNGKNWLIN